MVHYILLACSLMITGLYTASGDAECNLTISKTSRNKDNFFLGKIDRRDYVEYHVTYINAFKEPFLLEKTNTSRFQPTRWFNIHSHVENALPVTYDFLFNTFDRVFHIQRENIEINVTPMNCIYTIDFEKLEELTRNLFLDVPGTNSNTHICSAHIDDNDGDGGLIFNCCRTEHECHKVVDHFKWQQILHAISITATVTILISVFVFIYSNPSIGTDEFTFHPDDARVISSRQDANDSQSDDIVISMEKEKEMLKMAKLTTAAAKEIIRLVNYITSSTDTANTYTENEHKNRNDGLAERVQQATENLRKKETALKNIIIDLGQNNTSPKPGELAFESVSEAAKIVQRGTKGLQNSKVSYTFEKNMQAYHAVEESEKANKEAVKALKDYRRANGDSDALEVFAEEKLKSAIKNAVHAARKAKETAAILLESKTEATVKPRRPNATHKECIKLRVFKERCVDESKLAIRFLRCFTEFVTGIDNSFCKKKKDDNNCCCSCCCSYKCRCIFGRIVSFLLSFIVVIPFALLWNEYEEENKDYNELCAAYEDRGYTCPFNVIEIPKALTWTVFGFYGLAKLFYACAPINYLKMTVCRVPGCSQNIINSCKKCEKSECCNRCNFFQLILNILYQLIIYLSWGLSLYTLLYFILTVIILSSNTKHKWDDIILIFFPLAVIVYEYIQNVTHKYKVITEKILTLIRTDPEFKCLPSEHKENKAILLLGANKRIEGHIERYGCRDRLKFDRPFIFLEANGNVLISKRFVSQIYNDSSESISCELSAYLKALLLCILPAFAYGCLLYLLITYISIFSFSNDVAGYVVSVATYLQLIKYKIECFLRDFLLKDSSSDPRFLEKFRKHLNSFTESWIIADFVRHDNCNDNNILESDTDSDKMDPMLPKSYRLL